MKKILVVFLVGLMASSVMAATVKGKKAKPQKIQTQKVEPLKQQALSKGPSRGWLVAAAFGGGGGILDFAYNIPMANFNLLLDAGYGLGNSYSIIKGGVAAVFERQPVSFGLEVGAANYSKSVSGVAGVSGTIDKGTKIGVGLFVTKAINEKFCWQAGYNSALGATAGVTYKL